LHCYSSSGPTERDELDPTLLRRAVFDASAEGFTVLALSGGEPLLYRSLRLLLDDAHSSGMVTTVTTNGMLLNRRRLESLHGAIDLLALSLDGVPESHNRMRASDHAFEAMANNLGAIRESGIPFGFIFTLTQYNLDELDWVYRFAKAEGAKLLQIHPLEMAGRAVHTLADARPDSREAVFAELERSRLQTDAGADMLIHLDFVSVRSLSRAPDRAFATDVSAETSSLSELASPMVIEEDGTVVPLQYGMAREYALGNLHDANLRQLGQRWRRIGYKRFRSLCGAVFQELTISNAAPYVNWYEAVAHKVIAADDHLSRGPSPSIDPVVNGAQT
jgi:MoaA/NifB/PqqE/SkfB family radical SAM enzyme